MKRIRIGRLSEIRDVLMLYNRFGVFRDGCYLFVTKMRKNKFIQKNDKKLLTDRKSCDTILNCIIIANYAKKRLTKKNVLIINTSSFDLIWHMSAVSKGTYHPKKVPRSFRSAA